jgi:hypothetical protein
MHGSGLPEIVASTYQLPYAPLQILQLAYIFLAYAVRLASCPMKTKPRWVYKPSVFAFWVIPPQGLDVS